MKKKIIIGIFINLSAIYFVFVLNYMIFNFQYGYYFSQAFGNMVYISPIIFFISIFILSFDIQYYKSKKKKWAFIVTGLVYLMATPYILLGNFGSMYERKVFLLSFIVVFLISQFVKFILYYK